MELSVDFVEFVHMQLMSLFDYHMICLVLITCLMNESMLVCLQKWGSTASANFSGSKTLKYVPSAPQQMMELKLPDYVRVITESTGDAPHF